MRLVAIFAWIFAAIVVAAPARAQDEGDDQEEVEGEEGEGQEGEGEEAEEGEVEEEEDLYEPSEAGPRTPRTICHGRRIRRIRVEGVRRVDADDIRATMQLRAGVPCTDEEVAADARAIWDLGFFDDIIIEADVDGEEVDLVVTAVERPAIRDIEFRGNDEVNDDDLDEAVTLREGEILSISDVQRQVTRIRDKYAEEGFFLARVRYELVPVGDDGAEVDVRFVIREGEEVTVRRIRFTGNDHLESDDILEVMQTSETGFFSFITSSDTFNQEHFDEDLVRLQAYYYDFGYLAVQVGSERVELTPDRQYIDITIPIVEGPRFRIGGITVEEVDEDGNEIEPLLGRQRTLDRIDAERGEWFSRSKIGTSLQDITRAYRDRGFASVEIQPGTDLDMEDRTVDITVRIQRGPPVTIERINIRGNTKTRDQVIRREMRINEGELYSQTDLEESKRRITALGYFERVDISEEEGSQPDRIVIHVEVSERSTGTFQVGAGFSSIESFIITAQIQQQNFLGRGQSMALQLQLSGIRQLAQIRFVEPYFFGSEWSVSFDAFKTIRQYNEFVSDTTGAGVGFGHAIIDDRFRFALQYEVERVNISARTGGLFGAPSGASGFNIFRTLPLNNLLQDGRTSSFSLSLSWDSRDNRLFPTDGIHTAVTTEVADRFTGSENVFVRNTGFFRFYRQLFDFLVLKINMELGLVTSRLERGVPIFERFFLGGIFNVRGFRLQSLGPRVGLQRGFDPLGPVRQEGEAIGGNLQAFYNVELEFPIVESVGIRGVIFTDGGNAWNLEDALCGGPQRTIPDGAADPCEVNILRLRTSWGFGFRWFSPLGPLRFEWGIPFHPRSFERKILFEFTIGNFF